MVFVRVGQDDDVQAAVPRRDPLVERDEHPVRVRAAVDEHPGTGARLQQDRVALADVEHRDPGGPRRSPTAAPASATTIAAATSASRGGRARSGPRRRAPAAGRRPGSAPPRCIAGARSTAERAGAGRRAATAPPTGRRSGGERDRRERHGGADPDEATIDVQDEPAGKAEQRADDRRAAERRDRAARQGEHAAAIATGTSGTTARFTTGDTSDSRPNVATTSGSVAACAASEIPRLSASQPRHATTAQPAEPRPDRVRPREQARPSPGPRAGTPHHRSAPGRRAATARRPPRGPRLPDPRVPTRARAARRRPSPPRARPTATRRPRPRRRRPPRARRPTTRRRRPAQHRTDEPGDDGDVPARDRDDVADAGRREVRGQVRSTRSRSPIGSPPRVPPPARGATRRSASPAASRAV